MADHLIPDLGVLKTHPVSSVQGCTLEFTNGMSANERFGCVGNWKRLDFDRQDPNQEPTVMLSTVVNNRADRVARSRVFASVLVADLSADHHFLIGGNLKGLQGFIWESWEEFARSVSLRSDETHIERVMVRRKLLQLAQKFRVPVSGSHLENVIQTMLTKVVPDLSESDRLKWGAEARQSPDAIFEHLKSCNVDEAIIDRIRRHVIRVRRNQQQLDELLEAANRVSHPEQLDDLEVKTRQTLKEWFAAKLVVIEDYNATGDEIIQRIVDETPPGFLNRVMGVQNIKGTGLDFVYRFHAWDTCHQACQTLEAADPDARIAALAALAALPEYGLLCLDRLQATMEALRRGGTSIPPSAQVQIETIQRKLSESLQLCNSGGTTLRHKNRLSPGFFGY